MRSVKIILMITVISAIFVLLVGCGDSDNKKRVDYSKYPFTDTSWTRKAEHDIETIRFGSDGSFAYWCACGNPVNDSDLNKGYIYDDKNKTITIEYFETTDDTVSTIMIESCDDENIKLSFDGEIREFTKDKK